MATLRGESLAFERTSGREPGDLPGENGHPGQPFWTLHRTAKEPVMITLDTRLAHFEIDRRLRAADHHRRIRWGRRGPSAPPRTPRLSASAGR
jgi:hypothetical protein